MKITDNLKIRLNTPLRGLQKGKEIIFGDKGMKLDKYWMNRIKDSKIDDCITIIDTTQIESTVSDKIVDTTQIESTDSYKIEMKKNKKMRSKNVS